MNKEYFDLAYAFRKSKIWKKIDEEEVFAVRLPGGKNSPAKIGYCVIMGRSGEHLALAVYMGEEGLSALRRALTMEHRSFADMMSQDCIQCSLEGREDMEEEELDALRAYCRQSGEPFRPPYPKYTRYTPYCVPWYIRKQSDWQAIGTALRIVNRMAETVAEKGKSALGLRQVDITLPDPAYGSEQLSILEDLPADEVTVPLYSLEKRELKTERIPLPPCREKRYPAPTRINEIAVARMMKHRQAGEFECEVIRVPGAVEGDPPYFPAMLLTVDEDGMVRGPMTAEGAEYDPNELLNRLISNLSETDYPRRILVRTEETRVLLADFCRRAKIRLEVTDELDALDEACESMRDYMSGGPDGGFDEDDPDEEEDGEDLLDDMIGMLDDMPVSEIRKLPPFLLNQLLEMEELLPEEIAAKLRKAKKK